VSSQFTNSLSGSRAPGGSPSGCPVETGVPPFARNTTMTATARANT